MPDLIDDILPNLSGPELLIAQASLRIGGAPIADKAAAYALTGVVAGTVYETADTGQIMEYLGDVAPFYTGFTIAGSSGADGNTLGYNGDYIFVGGSDTSTGNVQFQSTTTAQKFDLQSVLTAGSGGFGHKDSQLLSFAKRNPADVVTWVALDGTGNLLQSEFTKASPESNIYNWKINGVVSVFDNDDKQLLTNLPDTQQVEVVGEGGRIERYNGDNQPDGSNFGDGDSFYVEGGTYTNGGTQDFAATKTLAINRTLNVWNTFLALGHANLGSEDWLLYADASSYVPGGTAGTANKWGILSLSTYSVYWESLEDSDTVHPADATWVAVNDGVTAPTATRAPEAMESNWSDIVPTHELIITGFTSGGAVEVDGVSCDSGQNTVVGWRTGSPLTVKRLTHSSIYSMPLRSIDGSATLSSGGALMVLPDSPTLATKAALYPVLLPKVRAVTVGIQ